MINTATLEQPAVAPKANKINETPTTPAQIEQYERYLDRRFVRINPKTKEVIHVTNPTGNELEESKEKFFYKVTDIFMRYFGWGNMKEGVARFNVKKYHADKMVTTSKRTANGRTEIKENKPVARNVRNEILESWDLLDADTDFAIDCVEFDKNFKVDQT